MGDIVKRCESARRLLSLGYDWEKNLARLTQEPATEACLSNYFGWLVPRGELGKTPVCSLASTQNRGQKTDVCFMMKQFCLYLRILHNDVLKILMFLPQI